MFDDEAIERLKLAAVEVAWLTGRGYPLATVGELVAGHHGLTPEQWAALARGTCSEPQYRRRAARELEAEDIARRPLALDTADVLAAVEAALDGRPVMQTLDGTVRALEAWTPGARTAEALAHVLAAAKELRPSMLRFVVADRALEGPITDAAKKAKAKAEVVEAADVRAQLRKEKAVVTGDADTLDACAGWFNLVGRILAGLPGARVVRLQ